jgi:hypothetical protein
MSRSIRISMRRMSRFRVNEKLNTDLFWFPRDLFCYFIVFIRLFVIYVDK